MAYERLPNVKSVMYCAHGVMLQVDCPKCENESLRAEVEKLKGQIHAQSVAQSRKERELETVEREWGLALESLHNVDTWRIHWQEKSESLTRSVEAADLLNAKAFEVFDPKLIDGWLLDLHDLCDEYEKTRPATREKGEGDGE